MGTGLGPQRRHRRNGVANWPLPVTTASSLGLGGRRRCGRRRRCCGGIGGGGRGLGQRWADQKRSAPVTAVLHQEPVQTRTPQVTGRGLPWCPKSDTVPAPARPATRVIPYPQGLSSQAWARVLITPLTFISDYFSAFNSIPL